MTFVPVLLRPAERPALVEITVDAMKRQINGNTRSASDSSIAAQSQFAHHPTDTTRTSLSNWRTVKPRNSAAPTLAAAY
ncbi:MAG: hypothetical protein LC721_12180 [Actinobacteria bacterium]|nr:hypothetical protein [Actinomycetota bacterium]